MLKTFAAVLGEGGRKVCLGYHFSGSVRSPEDLN